MRKCIHLLFVLFALIACEQSYTTKLIIDGEVAQTFEDIITASSDDEAYKSATEFWNGYLEVYENDYLNSTVDFYVFKKDGSLVFKKEGEYVLDIEKKQEERNQVEQKKAYAGALFGMSKQEVKDLPHFSEYKTFPTLLENNSESIGSSRYKVELAFDEEKDELFMVRLTSLPAGALEYDKLEDYVDNIKAVIERKYGKPTLDNGFPSFLLASSGKYPIAYKWEIGTKEICISVGELSRSDYGIQTFIVDRVRYKEREENQIAASDGLF